VKNGEIAKITQ